MKTLGNETVVSRYFFFLTRAIFFSAQLFFRKTDLNGDHRAEAIVFYNHTGGNLVDMRTWPGTANREIAGEPGGPWSASGWDGSRIIPAGTGDYNGDGAADLATFYRHDGRVVDMNVWYGNGTGALTLQRPWTTATGWEGARLIPAKG